MYSTAIEPWIYKLWNWADEFNITEIDLPRNKDSLLQLTTLSLRYLKLPYLDEGIGYLKNLKTLEIRCNELVSLPDSIFELIHLKHLVVQSDLLEKLPENINKLGKLQTLKVSGSRLTEIPHSIGELKDLEKLILTCENLKQLPISIRKLTKLTLLNVRYCKISNLQSQLSVNLIKRCRNKKLKIVADPIAKLYTSKESPFQLSYIALFNNNDDWTEDLLQELRYQSSASFIIGLDTADKTDVRSFFDIGLVDCVIKCDNEDVLNITTMFEPRLQPSVIQCDANDFRTALNNRVAYFIKDTNYNPENIENYKDTAQRIIKKLPEDTLIKSCVVLIEWWEEFNLETFGVIVDEFENSSKLSFGEEEVPILYCVMVTKKPHCFSIRAIYTL